MSISRAAAVAAATELATDLGLGRVEPRLLRDSSNVLLHLRPSPLVARVATMTAVLRPGVHRWLARDISLAGFLAGRGLPVARPSTDPPPGPYEVGGITIALWRYVPHDPSALVEPAVLVEMLGSLHAALRDFPGPLADGPVADLDRALAALDGSLDPGVLRLLRADGARLGAEVSALAAQPLHGDAHPANVLVTPDGPVWNDFEDAWRGPVAWDYACVAGSGRPGDWAGAVAGRVDPAALAACRSLRRVFGVAWHQLLARRFPSRAAQARAALAQYAEGDHERHEGDPGRSAG
jgi:hypothetical protein